MKKRGWGWVSVMMTVGLFAACAAPGVEQSQAGSVGGREQVPTLNDTERTGEAQQPLPAVVCVVWKAACVAGCKVAPDINFCVALCDIIYRGCLQAPDDQGDGPFPHGGSEGEDADEG